MSRRGTMRGMRTTSYGQKGGEGATRGRKAETLVDPVGGHTKRVFFGQRWLFVLQRDEADKPLVRAYHTREEADEQKRRDGGFLRRLAGGEPPMIEYVVEGYVKTSA